mmetsp:Transcript_7309/g.22287  ORF Transcript_7309/g.22287 Transcript_7309/m.22287 type:complete len:293 (+) Transcript_7309:43-921(+)
MTRHSKNNTDSAVFTYHEKRRAGFGSSRMRLGAESLRSFDCCCLSLQPCREPMVSPDGYLFDKEYILENLLKQKSAIRARTKEWEEQESNQAATKEQEDARREQEEKDRFARMEVGASKMSGPQEGSADGVRTTRVTSHGVEVTQSLRNNFWLPTNTPLAEKTQMQKPDTRTRNPVSNAPLRVKELVSIKFTPIDDKVKSTSHEKKYGRYMCPVCSRSLTNSVKCAVLRTSHSVVCNECVERFVKKDKKDPVNAARMNVDRDVIYLQSGGTAYAASAGEKKEAKKYNPAMRV